MSMYARNDRCYFGHPFIQFIWVIQKPNTFDFI